MNRVFQQLVIIHLRDFIADWEQWTLTLPEGAAQEYHLESIRLAKGFVKAWRRWLIKSEDSFPQSS